MPVRGRAGNIIAVAPVVFIGIELRGVFGNRTRAGGSGGAHGEASGGAPGHEVRPFAALAMHCYVR